MVVEETVEKPNMTPRSWLIAAGLYASVGMIFSGCDTSQRVSPTESHVPTEAAPTATNDHLDRDEPTEVDDARKNAAAGLRDRSEPGVLAPSRISLPSDAPQWARAAAEIINHDGRLLLVATGAVSGITKRELARPAAIGRARAELSHWLESPRLVGSRVAEYWYRASPPLTLARVEIPLPDAGQLEQTGRKK